VKKKRVILAVNPAAKRVTGKKVEIISVCLGRRADLVDVLYSEKRGDITRIAREVSTRRLADLLVVFGGDGTLNEAVNGLSGDSVHLGFIPGGTSNVICHELNIPGNIERACEVALEGIPQKIRPGLAGGRRFLLMVGVGVDAEIVKSIDTERKKLLGKGEYILTGLKTFLRGRQIPFRVHVEGASLGPFVWGVFARSAFYAGSFRVVREADLREKILWAYLFRKGGRVKFMEYSLRTILGLPYSERDSLKLRGAGFTVSSEVPVPYQVDGDYAGETPVAISLDESPIVIRKGL